MAEAMPKPLTVLILLALPVPLLYIINKTLLQAFQLDALHYTLAQVIVLALLHQYLGLPNVSVLLDQLLFGTSSIQAVRMLPHFWDLISMGGRQFWGGVRQRVDDDNQSRHDADAALTLLLDQVLRDNMSRLVEFQIVMTPNL